MYKAIFYKEWIKTRWFSLLAFVLLMGFTGFCMLRVNRALDLKGAAHIWEVMLTRDAIFIDLLRYVPVLIGLLMAVVQFVPEVQRKCLKLTLHLPFSELKLTMAMLMSGLVQLLVIYGCSLAFMKIFLMNYFPIELQQHILLTSLPWFLSGFLAYIFGSWICLEPTWKRRVVYLLMACLSLRIFFLSDVPEAYNSFLIGMLVYVIATITLPWLSIVRFKAGKQD